jgi:energy-coupling factor transport system substrate-specific component
MTRGRILSAAIYGLSTGIGVIAFVYPFVAPSLASAAIGQAHSNDAPLMLTALVGLCFIVLLLEVQGQAVNAKFVALLGILVSMNAALRFLDRAIPGPGGFSPIFFLIVLTGYVYGGRFGFLMGTLTLLVSALITGGVGPWLPYQMFAAGWIGMSAPLCRLLVRLGLALPGLRSQAQNAEPNMHRLEVIVLAAFAGLWGLAYGGILNISFWPFAVGATDQYWEPGISLGETLRRYGAFYLATSLAWDIVRAAGNVLFTLVLGASTLRVLRRFRQRFAFSYQPGSDAGRRESASMHVQFEG